MFLIDFIVSFFPKFLFRIRIIVLMVLSLLSFHCGLPTGNDCSKATDEAAICELAVYIAYPSCVKEDRRTSYQFPSNPSTYTVKVSDTGCELTRFALVQGCKDQKKKKCGD